MFGKALLIILILSCVVILGIVFKHMFYGYLRIDTTNPEKDVYRFDFSKDIMGLKKRKYVIIKIDKNFKKSQ